VAGKPVNEKCKACSTIPKFRQLEDKPPCYEIRVCARRRSYYRDHDKNKRQQRKKLNEKKGRGEGCGVCGTMSNLQVHHIVPISIGGHETHANKMTLCNWCHRTISIYYAMIGLMNVKIEYAERAKRV
jgi:hypothetical protein